MPANVNPRVAELLTWHGHASGGVHVPFQARSNPIGRVIETSLVRRLRRLAKAIAQNAESLPRWVFLVGGPGNGKSETVQDFLSCLDAELQFNGALCQLLQQRFSSAAGVLPRKVEVLPAHLGELGTQFAATVGRLIVIQDATATESALGNAASELAYDVADLLTTPESPLPVFLVCANRGLLSRAVNEAYRAFGKDNNTATTVLTDVIQASGLGRETLAGRKSCWPIASDPRVACWPLDVESLLAGDTGIAPFEGMLLQAVDAGQWETAGRCTDCDSRELCPFMQNAEWLRDDATRNNLLTILRHGELARGQRWNFRDSFSLIAELLVGQWSDFEDVASPCTWVHQNVSNYASGQKRATSAIALSLQLYGNALFRGGHVVEAAKAFLRNRTIDAIRQPVSFEVLDAISRIGDRESTKSIREMLAHDYLALDSAIATPPDQTHPLRIIEDAFCQSVEQGRIVAAQTLPLASAENLLLDIFEKAEAEWNLLGRESATAVAAVCLLRKLAALLTKRSIGVRLGSHALGDLLVGYEAALRSRPLLNKVRDALLPLLGDPGFSFNVVEIIGQPTAESKAFLNLQGLSPGVQILVAPTSTDTAPGHDVPCVEVSELNYRIALTFDFYKALQLRKNGCAGSSLPASVRAAIDRVRHRYAGELCRKEDRFVDGRTFIMLGTEKKLGVPAPGSQPNLDDA